ncbi:MAG: hypothetical protein PSX71_14045 [bacterium]|nr:hypothetical protein [bacterium]
MDIRYQLNGLDDIDWSKIASGITDIVKQAAPVVLAAKQQKDLQKLNVARASQGLPPLDTAAYAEASAPVVKVQGGADAGTRKIIWGFGLGTLVLIGTGIYFATRKKRGR